MAKITQPSKVSKDIIRTLSQMKGDIASLNVDEQDAIKDLIKIDILDEQTHANPEHQLAIVHKISYELTQVLDYEKIKLLTEDNFESLYMNITEIMNAIKDRLDLSNQSDGLHSGPGLFSKDDEIEYEGEDPDGNVIPPKSIQAKE